MLKGVRPDQFGEDWVESIVNESREVCFGSEDLRVGCAHPPAQGSRVVHPRACSRELIVARALVVVSCPGAGTSSPRKNTPFPAKDGKTFLLKLYLCSNYMREW